MEEKKTHNESMLENARAGYEAERKNRRAGSSISTINPHDKLSFEALLPQLKVATEQSNTKLTQRMVRIAGLI